MGVKFKYKSCIFKLKPSEALAVLISRRVTMFGSINLKEIRWLEGSNFDNLTIYKSSFHQYISKQNVVALAEYFFLT